MEMPKVIIIIITTHDDEEEEFMQKSSFEGGVRCHAAAAAETCEGVPMTMACTVSFNFDLCFYMLK